MTRASWVAGIIFSAGMMMPAFALTGESANSPRMGEPPTNVPTQAENPQLSQWHFGGFVDLGYSLNFNFPENGRFRNRATTPRGNEFVLNMGGISMSKDATEQSPWGTELLVHGGEDATTFGFGTNLPRVSGSQAWRHFGRANVSYLAPVGNGLTLQGGLFNSLIGYESLYAKDNANYTRAWLSDYSPYLMFGVNAVYPFNDRWTGAVFVINEFFHLQNANDHFSYGAQALYTPGPSWTVKETIYYGPDQSNTSLEFWRFFSDTLVAWKHEHLTIAGQYQVGTQKEATAPGNPRSLFMGAALPMHWHISGPWSTAFRPEVYWDRDGLMTGFDQFIWAITTTAEYRLPYQGTHFLFRLEYRYDSSTGPGGGFFRGQDNTVTRDQNLLIFSVNWAFDSA
jgi:hypothetical protein